MGIPISMRPVFEALPAEAKVSVSHDYERRRKSKTFGYLAWLFLGWHYLYMRRVGLQIAFWLTGGGLLVWWLIDLFRVGPKINRMNEDTARELMVQYKALYATNEVRHYGETVTHRRISGGATNISAAPDASRLESGQRHRPIEDGRSATGPLFVGLAAVALLIAGAGGFYFVDPSMGGMITTQPAFMTTRNVNIRVRPTTNSEDVGSLPAGAVLHGTMQPGVSGRMRWLRISGGRHDGRYVSALNLEEIE